MPQECLRIEHICKAYSEGVVAIQDACLVVQQGEIHGLLGENGAGKSTFSKIISGQIKPDSGLFELMGKPVHPQSATEAAQIGIVRLQKHSGLVPSLTVEENILLGHEKGFLRPLPRKQMRSEIAALLKEFAMDPGPADLAQHLTAEDALETEVLKAYYAGAHLIILDEPASYFSVAQTQELFALLRKVAAKGVAILYVSNQVDEMLELCDNITVLVDGITTKTVPAWAAAAQQMKHDMEHEGMAYQVSCPPAHLGDTVLKVRGLSTFRDKTHPVLNNVSFSIRSGEILALVGKPGSGIKEICEVVAGLVPAVTGQVLLYDDDILGESVRGVRDFGVSFLISNPQRTGVVPSLSIQENLLPYQYTNPEYRNHGFLDKEKLKEEADRLIKEYDIRCISGQENAGTLSTSSAQKLLAAREFSNEPVLLVAYQPTAYTGDSAAAFLKKKLIELRDEGTAILLVPTDWREFSTLADSVVVLHQGSVAACIHGVQGNEDLNPYINGQARMSNEELEAVCFE
ncbi:MAG: ATP-binding cassette domain-containing protein [Pygmaiobacter sp.]|nr:ATP-binding cassette domain-containing protein [Pygmaiobacter sp.]